MLGCNEYKEEPNRDYVADLCIANFIGSDSTIHVGINNNHYEVAKFIGEDYVLTFPLRVNNYYELGSNCKKIDIIETGLFNIFKRAPNGTCQISECVPNPDIYNQIESYKIISGKAILSAIPVLHNFLPNYKSLKPRKLHQPVGMIIDAYFLNANGDSLYMDTIRIGYHEEYANNNFYSIDRWQLKHQPQYAFKNPKLESLDKFEASVRKIFANSNPSLTQFIFYITIANDNVATINPLPKDDDRLSTSQFNEIKKALKHVKFVPETLGELPEKHSVVITYMNDSIDNYSVQSY